MCNIHRFITTFYINAHTETANLHSQPPFAQQSQSPKPPQSLSLSQPSHLPTLSISPPTPTPPQIPFYPSPQNHTPPSPLSITNPTAKILTPSNSLSIDLPSLPPPLLQWGGDIGAGRLAGGGGGESWFGEANVLGKRQV